MQKCAALNKVFSDMDTGCEGHFIHVLIGFHLSYKCITAFSVEYQRHRC